MSDQTIRCADCGTEFVFSEGEQQFYAERQFTPPRRCKPCRQARREQQGERETRAFGAAPKWSQR